MKGKTRGKNKNKQMKKPHGIRILIPKCTEARQETPCSTLQQGLARALCLPCSDSIGSIGSTGAWKHPLHPHSPPLCTLPSIPASSLLERAPTGACFPTPGQPGTAINPSMRQCTEVPGTLGSAHPAAWNAEVMARALLAIETMKTRSTVSLHFQNKRNTLYRLTITHLQF